MPKRHYRTLSEFYYRIGLSDQGSGSGQSSPYTVLPRPHNGRGRAQPPPAQGGGGGVAAAVRRRRGGEGGGGEGGGNPRAR